MPCVFPSGTVWASRKLWVVSAVGCAGVVGSARPLGRHGCCSFAVRLCSVTRGPRSTIGSEACFIEETKHRVGCSPDSGPDIGVALLFQKSALRLKSFAVWGVDANRLGTTSQGPMTRPLFLVGTRSLPNNKPSLQVHLASRSTTQRHFYQTICICPYVLQNPRAQSQRTNLF